MVTGDGSLTLQSPDHREHYHSTYGAVTESRHIFIEAGLKALPSHDDPVRILEVGFGTGLNALLTLAESVNNNFAVAYDALEPFPLEPGIWEGLGYAQMTGNPGLEKAFFQMHRAETDAPAGITSSFNLVKLRSKVETVSLAPGKYHLVYFDPFSPDSQPEIWVPGVFSKMFGTLKPGGILVTYCVKGTVTRGLRDAGFRVEKLPGPPGKRHILRGTKDVGRIDR